MDNHTDNFELSCCQCPYFKSDKSYINKDGDRIYAIKCECSSFKFPDIVSRREFVYKFCAHPYNYKTCELYNIMNRYYDRKYKERK